METCETSKKNMYRPSTYGTAYSMECRARSLEVEWTVFSMVMLIQERNVSMKVQTHLRLLIWK